MSKARQRELSRGLQWAIIEHHYRARRSFMKIFKMYEARVSALVKERHTARDRIRLTAAETRLLFDTPQLEALLRDELEPLRRASHAYFRDSDIAEPYDSKVSRIYHELSILKEEHLSVRDWPKDGGSREFARLFREVSDYYPQRLRRVRDLFQRTTKRLEILLPRFADNPVVLRSAFLFRDELWPDQTRSNFVRFLSHMFEAKGAVHGFLVIARSFFRAAFFFEAAACARMGVAASAKEAQARSTYAQSVRETISELDRLTARAESELETQQEMDA